MIHKPPKRVKLPLASLIPNPRNTQVHPLAQISMIAASVKLHGQVGPIVARTANRMLISGHGVAEAMKQAGETEADVYLWDVDQPTADRFMVAANQLAKLSRTDNDRLRDILADTATDEFAALGFKEDEVDKLLARDDGEDLAIREIETSDVGDRAWFTILCPLKDQAKVFPVLKQLEELSSDIRVEMGTTNLP